MAALGAGRERCARISGLPLPCWVGFAKSQLQAAVSRQGKWSHMAGWMLRLRALTACRCQCCGPEAVTRSVQGWSEPSGGPSAAETGWGPSQVCLLVWGQPRHPRPRGRARGRLLEGGAARVGARALPGGLGGQATRRAVRAGPCGTRGAPAGGRGAGRAAAGSSGAARGARRAGVKR